MPMTSVDIKKELWEKIKILAIKRRTSLKAIINEAIKEYLKRQEK